ncbi:phosphate system positive regulatory protein pho81 [Irineochytrium annulatum]|nr:phosphate system positive regulatory protein pho81 [Irineochytrium annulatum]
MKFGKYIQEQQTDWGGSHYLNYKALKKIINSVEGDHGLSATNASGAQPQDLQALKTAFFFKLERELEKINAFYLQKEAEFKVRLRSLADKKRLLLSRPSALSLSTLGNLKEALSMFQHDLTKLQNYVEVNATGFRKILKKWDKRAKSSTKELYLSRQVEIQPCFNNDILAELTDAATTNLADVDALLDDALAVGPALSKETSLMKNRQSDDASLDFENDVIALFHVNRTADIKEMLEKRRSTHPNSDDSDVVSRVYFRIAAEASVELLQILLDTNVVNCNFADDINSRTCLHESAIAGKLDVLKMSCECGANIDAIDMYGRKPLHYAAMYGRDDCARFLISRGSSVDSVDLDDCTPLVYSIVGGHASCVQICLENGAQATVVSGGSNPLAIACEYGRKDIATLLLAKGASVSVQADSFSVLHVAAREGHADLCALLIEHGADLEVADSFKGWTPIFYAASEGHLECVKILIAAGCSIKVRDENDWLPWTYALHRGHIEIAKLLEVSVEGPSGVAGVKASPIHNRIQPMAPSALFVDDMDMDGANLDSIPSLSLPPPIIPFRIYGHNYLDKKVYLQVNLSSFADSDDKNPIKLFGTRQLSSLKLIISTKPDVGIPYSVILPLKDDSEIYTFLVDNLTDFSLQFDIFPTFGTKVLGRAVVLASQLTMARSNRSPGAGDNEKCIAPLFDTHLRVIGELSFDFSIVDAFDHPALQIGGKVETYWKTTQVVGSAKSNAESGVRSFITASSLVDEYVNVVVQVTQDLVPVVYSNWFLPTSLNDIKLPLSSISASRARSFFTNMGETSERWRKAGSNTTDISAAIYDGMFSLEEVLKDLPATIGLCVEVKFSTPWERDVLGLHGVSDVNLVVDTVLKTVYDHAANRSIIFSSLNPSVCTSLSWKQPNYGVFFKTYCGYGVDHETQAALGQTGLKPLDKRLNSIKEAVRFAKKNNFLGVICEATPLIKVPMLVNTIKESGLILATFGVDNNRPENVRLQEAAGVDAIISRNVLRYNVYLRHQRHFCKPLPWSLGGLAAVKLLNTCQTNAAILEKIRKSGNVLNKRSIPEMQEYLIRIGHKVQRDGKINDHTNAYQAGDLNALNIIHVAGTKGKGSTSAFCDSMVRRCRITDGNSARPLKTGMFTSPHLQEVRERIRINGSPISKEKFAEHFFYVWNSFEETKVDVVIMECGVGGQYDATNVVERPVVSAITSLGFDHMGLLGNSLKEIAWHKAGIMKAGIPAFTAPQPAEAMDVLTERATELEVAASMTDAGSKPTISLSSAKNDDFVAGVRLGLAGAHQRINAALAYAVCKEWIAQREAKGVKIIVTDEDLRAGLEFASWPGRAQTVSVPRYPDIDFFLDGAHTPESLKACADWFTSVSAATAGGKTLIFSCTGGRDPKELLTPLAEIQRSKASVDTVIFCPAELDSTTRSLFLQYKRH